MRTLWKNIIIQKFSKPIVLIFLLLASLFISFVVASQGLAGGLFILIVIIALPIVYAVVAYPKLGILVLIIAAFLLNYVSRLSPQTPVGVAMDALTYLLIIGFFIKQKKERDWSYFNDPISYLLFAWLIYNILEVLNPVAASKLAWVYTVRTVAFILLLYYVFVFQIRTKEFIKLLIKVWLAFCVIAAFSAFQQENIGFLGFEKQWLNDDPQRIQLLFIYGHMRKFAIFSDPVVFAYNMVIGSLLCIALLFTHIKLYKKILLCIMMCFFLWVMLYSGTRAAYVLIPAALVMLAILKFTKKLIVPIIIGGLMLGVLIKIPTSNGSLVRFQSAFKPSNDASFNVRAENQRRIRPYILTHPIGGGLGSVGVWGIRFAPNSFLAKFPPDSGYARVAVELGYIGLFLFCLLNFIILYKGILYYYYIKDPELKTYCLAMILIIFALDIGNYPQQAIVQYPTNILFYLAVALLNVTMRLDIEKTKLYPQPII